MSDSMTEEKIQERYQQIAHKQVADLLGWTPAEIRRNLAYLAANGGTYLFKRTMKLVKELVDAKAAMMQVDDVLVTSWIAVKDNDYRKALNDLVIWNIQLERDPTLKQPAQEFTPGGCSLVRYPGPVLAAIEEKH